MLNYKILKRAIAFIGNPTHFQEFFDNRYDRKTNRWTNIANMNARRLGVAVSVLNNQLYVVGGSDGTTPLNSVER